MASQITTEAVTHVAFLRAVNGAIFPLTASPGREVVCLRHGTQDRRTLRGAACRSGSRRREVANGPDPRYKVLLRTLRLSL